MLGHYRAFRLTGTEKVMDGLIGGAMKRSLDMGVYPVTAGTHQIFVNRRPNLERGTFLPRPKAVIVVGLGEEGKLRHADLVATVRQAVIAWAQRLAENPQHTSPDLQAGRDAARERRHRRHAPRTPRASSRRASTKRTSFSDGRSRRRVRACRTSADLRLIELYLDRATDAWRSLRLQESATPGRYKVTDDR